MMEVPPTDWAMYPPSDPHHPGLVWVKRLLMSSRHALDLVKTLQYMSRDILMVCPNYVKIKPLPDPFHPGLMGIERLLLSSLTW